MRGLRLREGRSMLEITWQAAGRDSEPGQNAMLSLLASMSGGFWVETWHSSRWPGPHSWAAYIPIPT